MLCITLATYAYSDLVYTLQFGFLQILDTNTYVVNDPQIYDTYKFHLPQKSINRVPDLVFRTLQLLQYHKQLHIF